jgi:uncharacterized protein YndB with AHSA1/START domain
MSVLEPIRRSVSVPLKPAEAFDLFTERMGEWWPVETHSRAASDFEGQGPGVERVEFQAREGGRVLEHLSNGEVLPWADVLAWEPPFRLVLAWKPNARPAPPTEVEVRFSADGEGTRVDLEHRGWERLGDLAAEAREGYDTGWIPVLARLEEAARRAA